MLIGQLLKNRDLLKATLIVFSLLVLVGGVVPVLAWLVLNMPPESLSVSLGVVYVWWGLILSVVVASSLFNALTKDSPEEK